MNVFQRCFLLAGGLFAILWAFVAFPSFWELVPARDAAMRIVADDRFKPGALADVLNRIETRPVLSQPELAWARGLVSLRIAEEAMARKSSEEADGQIVKAEESVKAALAVSPGDSFSWLLLYSVRTTRSGFDPQNLRYLVQSYAAGPLEGWISMRRSGLALAVFPMLTETKQSVVISEFANMVDSEFIEDTARNLMGIGWQYRDQLLGGLGSVDASSKLRLYKRLLADGIKVTIPGVQADERPWR